MYFLIVVCIIDYADTFLSEFFLLQLILESLIILSNNPALEITTSQPGNDNFGFGNRSKAELFHSRIRFGFGRLLKNADSVIPCSQPLGITTLRLEYILESRNVKNSVDIIEIIQVPNM